MAIRDNLNQLIRPLVWATGNTEYPFWGSGCSCMVGYRGHWLLVTAKHLTDADNPDNLCITPRDEVRLILPLKALHNPLSHDDFDTDHLDISILEVDQSKVNAKDIQDVYLLDFETVYCSSARLENGAKLLVVGIPKVDFDYKSKVFNFVRYQCRGIYAGIARYKGCHEMSFDPNQEQDLQSEPGAKMKLPTLDGFSGGPVFVDTIGKNNVVEPRLVGMAIRGSMESGKLYFMGSDLLKELMDLVTGNLNRAG